MCVRADSAHFLLRAFPYPVRLCVRRSHISGQNWPSRRVTLSDVKNHAVNAVIRGVAQAPPVRHFDVLTK